MLTCASTKPPKIPIKAPKIIRRVRKIQKRRDQQLKTVVDDISNIATQEIERLRGIAQELLDDPNENPIIIENEYEEKEDDE